MHILPIDWINYERWDPTSDVPSYFASIFLFVGPIPESIGQLQSLTQLFLYGNLLSGKVNISGMSPLMSRVRLRLIFVTHITTTTGNDHHSQRPLRPQLATTTTRNNHHSQRPPLTTTTTHTDHSQPPLRPPLTQATRNHHSRRPPLATTITPL
jgi:hypothetical protein